jgi:hypothetical protein
MTDLLAAPSDARPSKLKYVDKNHAYYLDGKRAKSVTTVAKVPEDGYALELWSKRMVAIGLASSPELIESVAAHFDDRDKLNELVEEAETVARSHAAATRGTAMHRVTERADRGEAMLLTDLLADTVTAWRNALDVAGYEVVPEYIERAVVYPKERICGRFDRIVRRKADGLLRILDLKSGDRALKYPHSIAIQLALYANAPWMAAAWDGESGETTEFEPLPDGLDREIGLVLHMPEPGRVAIGKVNIAAGWEIAHRAVFPILDWRDLDDLVTVVELELPNEGPADPFEGLNGEAVTTSSSSLQAAPPPTPPAPPAGTSPHARVEWIATRIGQLPPAQVQLLTTRWPAGVPTPKAMRAAGERDYTDPEVVELEAVLMPLERDCEAPFAGGDPCAAPPDRGAGAAAEQKAARKGRAAKTATAGEAPSGDAGDASEAAPTSPAVVPTDLDEGDPVGDDDIAAIAKAIDAVTPEISLQIRQWLTEMRDAGHPLELNQRRTRRRWSIARAILGLAEFDDEIARAAFEVVQGEQPTVPVGVAFAAVSIDEAERLADLARALCAGQVVVTYGDDSTCRITPAN